MLYVAAVDVSTLTGTVTLDTSGEPQISVNLATLTSADANSVQSSLFFPFIGWNGCLQHNHTDLTGVLAAPRALADYALVSLQSALQTALRAAATTAGWSTPSNIGVTQSTTTGKWTFSYSASITVGWTGTYTKYYLGFSASPGAGTSVTSDITPYWVIVPTVPGVSEATPDYEPSGIASLAVADDGATSYGIARTRAPYYCDWKQVHETEAKSQSASASVDHLFTFQDLFRHCRTQYPFVVYNAFPFTISALVYKFRSDGVNFKPSYYNQNANRWTHEFRCASQGFTGYGLL